MYIFFSTVIHFRFDTFTVLKIPLYSFSWFNEAYIETGFYLTTLKLASICRDKCQVHIPLQVIPQIKQFGSTSVED